MAIALTGTGGFFTRLGKIIKGLNDLDTYRGTGLNTRVSTIRAEFASNQQDVMDGLYSNQLAWQNTTSWPSVLQNLATTTLTRMAKDDGWDGLVPSTALQYLANQMTTASASIQKPTVTATVSTGTNTGTGVLRASVIDPVDGLVRDYPVAETINVVATSTAYSGGSATFGKESFRFRGANANTALYYNWPGGSNVTTTKSAKAVGDGVLTDGGFENWVITNTPSSWTIATGVAGTTILKSTTTPVTGAAGLQFVGDGTTLHSIKQTVLVNPLTAYAFNIFLRRSASPSTASIRFRLTDGSGTTINDAAGNANTIAQLLSSATTSYAAYGGYFRTPAVLPSTVYLEISFTVALPNAQTCDIDNAVLVAADEVYAGGPFACVFSGGTGFALNDSFSIAVANNLTVTDFGPSMDRLFGLKALGIRIPSAASPTISNSLIA
jgi:hypothetical protein